MRQFDHHVNLRRVRERDLPRPKVVHEEPTTTLEDTLREAGISSKRQAKYQRRMSAMLGKGASDGQAGSGITNRTEKLHQRG